MNKLEYWRATRRLTVRQLAEKSGISPKAISQIERGRVQHTYSSTLGKLAQALDIDIIELMELATSTERTIDPKLLAVMSK